MEKLGFLNNCGDQFTQIPDYFVPDILTANGRMMSVVLGAIFMTVMSFAACLTCIVPG